MKFLSADVGGTFTDLVLIDTDSEMAYIEKLSSGRRGSAGSIATGIKRLTKKAGVQVDEIDLFVHGCTVATNAFLMRHGARSLLITTKGFRDVLEIGNQLRPHLYALNQHKPAPVITRSNAIEIEERVDCFGDVVLAPSKEGIAALVEEVKARKPQAVVICLNFAYLNDSHEKLIEYAIKAVVPDVLIYISSNINPEIEEYPRANTTAVSAYVGPIIDKYVDDLEENLHGIGMQAPILLMRSDGGVSTPRAVKANPASILLSGPAGGVIASVNIAKTLDVSDVITFDMGGTSADFSAIVDGEARTVTKRVIDGQPVRMPTLDIETISSGGGSIAWVDKGGALCVGPESAGAVPGPVCYEQGGEAPTMTDAALILGYLEAHSYLGGEIVLDIESARKAVEEKIAIPLGMSVEEAAFGIISIANSQMVQAIRNLSLQRGFDVRRFSLLSFGGAGPLYSSFLQRALYMRDVLVPRTPGVFAAQGLLMTNIRHASQSPFQGLVNTIDAVSLARAYTHLTELLKAQLEEDGVKEEDQYFQYKADLRCVGQFHEITMPIVPPIGQKWVPSQVSNLFHTEHKRIFGHSDPSVPVELVNIRVDGIGKLPNPVSHEGTNGTEKIEPVATRPVYFGRDEKFIDTPVYHREHLPWDWSITGPGIITQLDTTTVILPGQLATVIKGGTIRICDVAG